MSSIYIPNHLKKFKIISDFYNMLTEYESQHPMRGSDDFLKGDIEEVVMKNQEDPVYYFIWCIVKNKLMDVTKDSEYIHNLVLYLTKLFYCVKGTMKIFDFMEKYLHLKFAESPKFENGNTLIFKLEEISGFPSEFSVDFDNALQNFLSRLIYSSDFGYSYEKIELTIDYSFKQLITSDLKVYRIFNVKLEEGQDTITPFNNIVDKLNKLFILGTLEKQTGANIFETIYTESTPEKIRLWWLKGYGWNNVISSLVKTSSNNKSTSFYIAEDGNISHTISTNIKGDIKFPTKKDYIELDRKGTKGLQVYIDYNKAVNNYDDWVEKTARLKDTWYKSNTSDLTVVSKIEDGFINIYFSSNESYEASFWVMYGFSYEIKTGDVVLYGSLEEEVKDVVGDKSPEILFWEYDSNAGDKAPIKKDLEGYSIKIKSVTEDTVSTYEGSSAFVTIGLVCSNPYVEYEGWWNWSNYLQSVQSSRSSLYNIKSLDNKNYFELGKIDSYYKVIGTEVGLKYNSESAEDTEIIKVSIDYKSNKKDLIEELGLKIYLRLGDTEIIVDSDDFSLNLVEDAVLSSIETFEYGFKLDTVSEKALNKYLEDFGLDKEGVFKLEEVKDNMLPIIVTL